ncbi:hypothetical protein L3X38_039011 [Prunus dulcis]|uniref:Uncharacterized protein n=1 Tax=Prunus dulcis TaxID=3755 RepID=A0AAD4V7F0_PRUDU|nr:hypothetical protein L3X38_039011 [Prunus dulcis]
MKSLRELTAKYPWNVMAISPDEGQFLSMLLKHYGNWRLYWLLFAFYCPGSSPKSTILLSFTKTMSNVLLSDFLIRGYINLNC